MKNQDSWNEVVHSDLANLLSRLVIAESQVTKKVTCEQDAPAEKHKTVRTRSSKRRVE